MPIEELRQGVEKIENQLEDLKNEIDNNKKKNAIVQLKNDAKKLEEQIKNELHKAGNDDINDELKEINENYLDIVYDINDLYDEIMDSDFDFEETNTDAELEDDSNNSSTDDETNHTTDEGGNDNADNETNEEEKIPLSEETNKESGSDGNEEEEDEEKKKNKSSIDLGLRFSVMGTAGIYGADYLAKKIDYKIMENSLNPDKIRSTINGAIEEMERQKKALKGTRLSDAQIETIDKHINKLREGLNETTDDIGELLSDRQKIGNKVDGNLLKGLDARRLSRIDDKIAEELLTCGGDITAMKRILERHEFKNIDNIDEILKTLAGAKNADELKSMTRILRRGTKFGRFVQTIKGAMLIDVAFLGFDVWAYIEGNNEAELIEKVNKARAKNKRQQAGWQLGIGLSSFLAEAAIVGLGIGNLPGAAVGLAIGAITTAVSMGADALIFDVKDFYLQNNEDFLRQKKDQVSQAILQGIHNKKEGNTSINEMIGSIRLDSGEKENSLEAACRSLLFLDEVEYETEFSDYAPFQEYIYEGKTKDSYLNKVRKECKKAGKDPEILINGFNEKRDSINKKIKTRMEYINKYFKDESIINELKKGNGIRTINEICIESRVYAKMHEEKEKVEKGEIEEGAHNLERMKEKLEWKGEIGRDTYKENLEKYKEYYFDDLNINNYKEKIDKIERLKKDNPTLYQEMMVCVDSSSLIKEDNEDQNYEENIKIIERYRERIELTQTESEQIKLIIDDYGRNMRLMESLIKADFDINIIKTINGEDDEGVIEIIDIGYERRGETEFVDDVRQNVLYRLAKEFYCYKGENTPEGLMGFFNEGNKSNHGIYYDNARRINSDGLRKDETVAKEGIDEIFTSENDVNKFVEKFMKDNFTIESEGYLMTHTSDKETLDTETEGIDDYLKNEYKMVFNDILREELSRRTTKKQEEVKNEIIDFVKKYSNGNYLEIPYYLLTKARRAGLGNLERQYIKRDNNQLEICVLQSELGNNPLGAKENYITKARENYTKEEMYYINRVDEAKNKLDYLFGIESLYSKESEIGIPREVKGLYSEKCREWTEFKERMLIYNANAAAGSMTLAEYNKYAEYFENLYRGMLISLSTFKISNDIDSYALFNQAESFGNLDYFEDDGHIKSQYIKVDNNLPEQNEEFSGIINNDIPSGPEWELDSIMGDTKVYYNRNTGEFKNITAKPTKIKQKTGLEEIEFFNNEKVINFYNEQITKQKIKYKTKDGETKEKTVQELWDNNNSDKERELARRASNIIITTILEKAFIEVGAGGIKSIKIGGNRKDGDLGTAISDLYGFTTQEITKRLQNLKIPEPIIRSEIEKQTKKKEIKPLKEAESKAVVEMKNIQKIIEETAKNIEWKNYRGEIKYDPEKKTLKSRGQETKIEVFEEQMGSSRFSKEGLSVNRCKLEGLSETLDIKEGLRLANFANWAKQNYRGKKIEVGRGKRIRETIVVDAKSSDRFWTRIISRDALNKNLPSFKSSEGRAKIAARLQAQCGYKEEISRSEGHGGTSSKTGGGGRFSGGGGGGGFR